MNKQRKVLITITYNELGIIVDTKAEELGSSAQPEIILCKYCKYKEEHHYEDEGQPPIIKYTCANKVGLAKGYQVHEWDFCSRAEREEDE